MPTEEIKVKVVPDWSEYERQLGARQAGGAGVGGGRRSLGFTGTAASAGAGYVGARALASGYSRFRSAFRPMPAAQKSGQAEFAMTQEALAQALKSDISGWESSFESAVKKGKRYRKMRVGGREGFIALPAGLKGKSASDLLEGIHKGVAGIAKGLGLSIPGLALGAGSVAFSIGATVGGLQAKQIRERSERRAGFVRGIGASRFGAAAPLSTATGFWQAELQRQRQMLSGGQVPFEVERLRREVERASSTGKMIREEAGRTALGRLFNWTKNIPGAVYNKAIELTFRATSPGVDIEAWRRNRTAERRQEVMTGRPVKPTPEWQAMEEIRKKSPELLGTAQMLPAYAAVPGAQIVGTPSSLTPQARNWILMEEVHEIVKRIEEKTER